MRASEMFRRRSAGVPYAGPAMVVMPVGASDIAAVAAVVERLGFRAEVYHDAGTALDTIEYKRPALVVHSYELPDMDGATFHGAVQKRAGGRRIPTLAIMPAEQTPDQHFGAQTGIMEYICRPFQADELASRLQGLLPHVGEEIPAAPAPAVRQEPPPARAPRSAARLDPSPPRRVDAPARDIPARPAPPREVQPQTAAPMARPGKLDLRVIGLGEWGIRGAERLKARGVTARVVDLDAGASDAFSGEADGDLIVVLANLGQGAGARLATLLQRLDAAAPGVPRLAIARLPGLRSGPDERALGLVALNAMLEESPGSILLVQNPAGGGSGEADDDSLAVLDRLVELCELAGSASDASEPGLDSATLVRVLGTPGFLGWREMPLTAADCAPQAQPWLERMGAEPTRWQPEGFAWGEAQALLPLVQAPRAWLEASGRRQYDRFVQEAWDEAAPCAVTPVLSDDVPARAALLSAGMPYPRGVHALRDSVEADRTRLAAKRRAAETLIPLGEGFLPREAAGQLPPVAGWTASGPPPSPSPRDERR
ncbi:MAG: response regulator, partial [Gemmatimonadota bacterium]